MLPVFAVLLPSVLVNTPAVAGTFSVDATLPLVGFVSLPEVSAPLFPKSAVFPFWSVPPPVDPLPPSDDSFPPLDDSFPPPDGSLPPPGESFSLPSPEDPLPLFVS